MSRYLARSRRGASVWMLSPVFTIFVVSVIGAATGLRGVLSSDASSSGALPGSADKSQEATADGRRQSAAVTSGQQVTDVSDSMSPRSYGTSSDLDNVNGQTSVGLLMTETRWLDTATELETLPFEHEREAMFRQEFRRTLDEGTLRVLDEQQVRAAREAMFKSPAALPQFGRRW